MGSLDWVLGEQYNLKAAIQFQHIQVGTRLLLHWPILLTLCPQEKYSMSIITQGMFGCNGVMLYISLPYTYAKASSVFTGSTNTINHIPEIVTVLSIKNLFFSPLNPDQSWSVLFLHRIAFILKIKKLYEL